MGKKNKSNSGKQEKPSDSLVIYRGPIVTRDVGVADDSVVELLTYVTSISGGTLGVQYYVGTNPSIATGWASFAARYDEYRVLGLQLEYWPHYPGGNAAVSHSAGFGVVTHSAVNPFPFTSVTNMVGYDDWTPYQTSSHWKGQWRMAATEEAQYVSTASPIQTGYIGFFAPTASSTGTYGYTTIAFRIQFRGRT